MAEKQRSWASILNSRYNEASDYLNNLSYGAGKGITSQLQGLQDAVRGYIKHPYNPAVTGVADASIFLMHPADNAKIYATSVVDSLRDMYRRATSGPIGLGEVIGENIDLPGPSAPPAFKKDIFIGENARTWNKDAEREFLKREKHPSYGSVGSSDDNWRATGTMRAPDGLLRQEITDHDSIYTPSSAKSRREFELRDEGNLVAANEAANNIFGAYLPEFLEHPALYAAYPDLRNVRVAVQDLGSNNYGMQHSGDDLITMHNGIYDGHEGNSTLLHEIQHEIQDYEQFASGGNSISAPITASFEFSRERNALPRGIEAAHRTHEQANKEMQKALHRNHVRTLLDGYADGSSLVRQDGRVRLIDPHTFMKNMQQLEGPWAWDAARSDVGHWPTNTKSRAFNDWATQMAQHMRNQHFEKNGGGWGPYSKGLVEQLRRGAQFDMEATAPQWQQLTDFNRKWNNINSMGPYDQYRNLRGEAEARLTESRMLFDEPARTQKTPFQSYDVPPEFTFGNHRR